MEGGDALRDSKCNLGPSSLTMDALLDAFAIISWVD
jgi:hypothetical protein